MSGFAPAGALATYQLTRVSAFGVTTRIRVVQRVDDWEIATRLSVPRAADDDSERVIWARQRSLRDPETIWLERLLRESSFWTLPASVDRDEQRRVLDGISWTLEADQGGQSRSVWRDDRAERPFEDLCRYLIALSGVDDPRSVSLWHRLRAALREALRKRKMRAEQRRRRRAIGRSNRQSARLADRMGKHALPCPHCGKHSRDMRYVDCRPHGRSYFICRSCGRSFHPGMTRLNANGGVGV